MKKVVRDELLRRLESGEYKQRKGRLRDKDSFCISGLICDIVFPDKWQMCDGFYLFGTYEFMLPYEVLDFCGLSYHEPDDLERMNDQGATFHQIAQYIRENIPETE